MVDCGGKDCVEPEVAVINAKKNREWNLFAFTIIILLIFSGPAFIYIVVQNSPENLIFVRDNILRFTILILLVPTLFGLLMYNRIQAETAIAILASIVGFAFGTDTLNVGSG
ncbi:hypothetical protein [Thalassospira sp. CH_XMU1458]|uniref:hypothetical protein n=1 Tax=Thalassospira sp. CH_XMU1458 TaxID=3107776 RepID=UPI00300CAC6C